jgi:phage terminase large subunit-like protein
LRLPDVIGRPRLSAAGGDWVRDVLRALFGSLVDGQRLVREIFLLVPKKNAKTTQGAALMLTALLMNRRPRAEFLFVGPTRMIADLAFEQAEGMIEADPEGYLQRRLHAQGHLKQITDRRTKARLLIKSFDAGVLTGVKPAGVLVD